MSQKRIGHIPNNGECYRVFEDKAFFAYPINEKVEHVYFQFENKTKAKEFKNNRSFKNTLEKKLEDFMFCDEKGFFCHVKYNKLLKSYGKQPSPPMNLPELWAIQEVFGLYTNLTDEEETELILSNVEFAYKNRSTPKEDEAVKTQALEPRLKQLCDRFGVNYIFADIFIEDIRHRYKTTGADDVETRAAKLLGLI